MEKRTEVKTIKVSYECPACNEGRLEFDEYLRNGVFYHTCDTCGNYEELPRKYPYIEYTEVTGIKSKSSCGDCSKHKTPCRSVNCKHKTNAD